MKLSDLTAAEQLVLGGLLRLMLRSDGQFSEAEEATLDRIGQRIAGGAEPLWKVISQSAQAYKNDDAILTAAKTVERREAQHMIRTLLEEVAAGDQISASEQLLLTRLQDLWA